MDELMSLTADLCSIPSGVVSDGNECLFERIGRELPLEHFRFPSGSEYNGWVVPKKWTVINASIHKNGVLIYDGKINALGVAHYSKSFVGKVSLKELKQHLYSVPALPDAHVFHCTWLYRPWANDWGFCPPHALVESLTSGDYDVCLETLFEPGEMLVAHHHKKGRSEKTIVFQSNTCHPFMANDGFAGTAVMIKLFQWLSHRDTHYSYRLVLSPEHLGTVFYLRDHKQADLDRYVAGVFGEMMGNKGDFVVASSFNGDEVIDKAFRHVVSNRTQNFRFLNFRESVGNDETVWEAPGYEIPFVQVNRALNQLDPFPEYHTNYDNTEIIEPELLREFLEVFKSVVLLIENNVRMHRRFDGLVALSNPKYDIYLERYDPSKAVEGHKNYGNVWGILQDSIVRYFNGEVTVLDVAEKHDVDFFELRDYIQKFVDRGLIEISLDEIIREPARRFS